MSLIRVFCLLSLLLLAENLIQQIAHNTGMMFGRRRDVLVAVPSSVVCQPNDNYENNDSDNVIIEIVIMTVSNESLSFYQY